MVKRNKTILTISIILLIISAIAFIIGGALAGWDFKATFTSNTAYCIYIILGLYVLTIIFIFTTEWIKKY